MKLNGEESEVKSLIGGSHQGTLLGQLLYIGGSDDAASEISDEDKYKYIDDLKIIELVSPAGHTVTPCIYASFSNITSGW